jgi:hypothetical protein
MTDLEAALRAVQDRQAIEDVVARYCRAIDRLDLDLLKSVYHPDGTDSHGSFEGNAHEFADFILQRMRSTTSYGFHTVTHSLIELDGDRASGETYYVGYHRIPAGRAAVERFFGPTYADRAEAAATLGDEHEYECGGRYLDVFTRRDGIWRIQARRITNEWSRCGAVSHVRGEGDVEHYWIPGSRDRTDPVYAIARAADTMAEAIEVGAPA